MAAVVVRAGVVPVFVAQAAQPVTVNVDFDGACRCFCLAMLWQRR